MAEPGTALVNMEEELQKQALAIASRISAPSGDRIRVTNAKTFKFPDGTEKAGPIDAVIVDFAAANFYYTTPYQEDNIQPPDCFAMGLVASDLAPSANLPAERREAEICVVCPHNQFKSASNGRGKACRNTYLLALLPPDATEDTPLMMLSVSPTAIKPFEELVNVIARKFSGPPMRAVVRIGFDPTVSYASLRFDTVNVLPNPNIALAFKRQSEARTRLLVEPDLTMPEVQPPVPTKGAPRGVIRQGGIKR